MLFLAGAVRVVCGEGRSRAGHSDTGNTRKKVLVQFYLTGYIVKVTTLLLLLLLKLLIKCTVVRITLIEIGDC